MKIPIQNIYYLLCYAWNKLDEKDTVSVSAEDATTLVDLFARVLIGGTNHLLKRGLDRGYINCSQEERCLRGKISFTQSIKRNLFIQAKVFCDYDELSYNVLHNKIVKATIQSLITVDSLNKDLKDQLIGLRRRLNRIDDIKLGQRSFSSVHLNRNNSFYDFLLRICEVIYDNLLMTEESGKTKFRDFLKDDNKMPMLFEDFVRNFYKLETQGCRVSRENIDWQATAFNENDEKFLPKMMTDISIENGKSKVVIDTKYYKEALITHYGQKKIRSEHLYQLYAYITNLKYKGGMNTNCSGILLYPTVDTDHYHSFQIGGHWINVCTINLNQDWRGIHNDLLDLLDRALSPKLN
jgi:5-methylcytosine-specific restriction enzyme subunit McrC